MERKLVNLSIFLMPLLGVFAYSVVSLAAGTKGGSGTGGGDVPLSSSKEVKAAIAKARGNVVTWLKYEKNWYSGLEDGTPTSVLYKQLYAIRPSTSEPISIWAAENSPFVVKDSGPCIDLKGFTRDGAVLDRLEPGSPICFSVPRLRRIPPDQLDREVTALVAHELTHEVLRSLNEDWPVKMQKELLMTYYVIAGDFVCRVDTQRDYKGDITGYQVDGFDGVHDCSIGCLSSINVDKDHLGQAIEMARKKQIDQMGRSVGCTSFKFFN